MVKAMTKDIEQEVFVDDSVSMTDLKRGNDTSCLSSSQRPDLRRTVHVLCVRSGRCLGGKVEHYQVVMGSNLPKPAFGKSYAGL